MSTIEKNSNLAQDSRVKRKTHILKLTESALMLALATALSFIAIPLPFGGSITLLSQLPVIVISYRHGLKWGLGTGLAMGLIQALLGLENLSYIAQTFSSIAIFFLADYLVAFAALGLGGIFRKRVKNQAAALTLGALLASFIRYVCHVVSGIAIWSAYAEENTLVSFFKNLLEPLFGSMNFWQNAEDTVLVYLYSIVYNASYMIFEAAITIAGAVLLSLVFNLKNERITPAIAKKKAEG